MVPNVVIVSVMGVVSSSSGAAVEHPVATRAKAVAPAMAIAVVRRESFTVTPLCAWMGDAWERSQTCAWERSHGIGVRIGSAVKPCQVLRESAPTIETSLQTIAARLEPSEYGARRAAETAENYFEEISPEGVEAVAVGMLPVFGATSAPAFSAAFCAARAASLSALS
jgi:hypothetical protein